MNVSGMYNATLRDGGGTFVPPTLRPVAAHGSAREGLWAVGMHRGTFATVGAATVGLGTLRAIVLDVVTAYPYAYVGTWLHEGAIHIDPVRLVLGRDEAMALGRGTAQAAIYNIDTGEEVTL